MTLPFLDCYLAHSFRDHPAVWNELTARGMTLEDAQGHWLGPARKPKSSWWQRLVSLLSMLLLILTARGASGQSPDSAPSGPPSKWNVTLFAGVTRSIDEDPLPATFGAGLGLRRRLGAKTGIALEASYLPIGPRSELRPLLGLGTYTRDRKQTVLRFGLSADFGLTRGPLRPTLLLGFSVARIHNSDHSLVVATTGDVLTKGDEERTKWGLGPTFGLGLGLPRIGGLFTPMVELRGHGIGIKSEEGWGGYTFATLGITLTH